DEEREQLSSGLALEIDRDRALVAVEPSEVRALAVRDGLEHSGEISAARALHLDHIGPEIGELHPAERPGHVVPDLDDAYPADERLPAPIEANDGAAIADRENVGRRRAGQRPQGCGDAGGERPPSRRLEAIRGAARADGPGRASREADHSEEVVL